MATSEIAGQCSSRSDVSDRGLGDVLSQVVEGCSMLDISQKLSVRDQLPKLPPAYPFFSLNNTLQVTQRMEGLQRFLEAVLKMPLLLSDSNLHLFLQSQLSIAKMEACVQGQTSYTVAEAIQCYETHFPLEDENKSLRDSDCESTSSGLGISVGTAAPTGSPGHQFLAMALDPEPFRGLSSSPESQQDTHT
ncbi:sorting nexin-10A isoform X2 [Pangasianodon hypophthalmus]|uniref:sorting nexin-10A isoform X2 n=1 Tax=Pangasianodon hypophthalmus TaxID=310915 RepID=UPI000EFFB30C|nr:sorting nexin-10A isoform X2 [Pangasianodon hypophthalmus]XP_034154478.1 sorting nexin-10A isoform X2 [Pangasianodon hypophthalmus]XP_053084466.1 sorting nexin-10A isoform X2 [Pangasianodon hypophthalmus]